MHFVSLGDSLYEMSSPTFFEKKKIFSKHA